MLIWAAAAVSTVMKSTAPIRSAMRNRVFVRVVIASTKVRCMSPIVIDAQESHKSPASSRSRLGPIRGRNWYSRCVRAKVGGHRMPEKATLERARRDKRQGKAPTTQAGEFVREEFHHIREGKHGARSTKQAIAIGLSKARRSGVKLPAPPASAKRSTKQSAKSASRAGGHGAKRPSARRARAVRRALKREGRSAASRKALARQARSASRRRSPSARSAAARRASHTKGPTLRRAAARRAVHTRQRQRRRQHASS